MGKKYQRKNKGSFRSLSKKFASENIQIRSKTKFRSYAAPYIKGIQGSAGAIAYRSHMASMGVQGVSKNVDGCFYPTHPPKELPPTKLDAKAMVRWTQTQGFIKKNGRLELSVPPRFEVMQRLERLTDDGSLIVYRNICLLNMSRVKVYLFFGGSEFFFLKVMVEKKKTLTSIVYGSHAIAMNRWRDGKIVWVDSVDH